MFVFQNSEKFANPPESPVSAWWWLLLIGLSACSDSYQAPLSSRGEKAMTAEELSHLEGAKGIQGVSYELRRQQWVQQFDTDANGFLDASEREAMRKTPKLRGKSFRREKVDDGVKEGKKGVRFDAPKHWVEKYDQDGDGGLSGEESEKGYWRERKQLFDRYDLNGNGQLEAKEIGPLSRDIDEGRYESWDHFVATTTLKDHVGKLEGRQPRLDARQREWLKWDLDEDGKASADELEHIRQHSKP
jgi:hypothetical protein